MKKNKISTRSIVLVGMFAAVIAVLAIFQIPMPTGVPATLTTFAIPLCGYVLGVKRGSLAAALYVLLGFVGIPVYAGMTAGPAILFGVTGGFLFGYITFAALCGVGMIVKNRILGFAFGILGLLSCHILGVLQYAFLTKTGLAEAALLVSLPFIVKDIIFTVCAYVVAMAVRKGLAAADRKSVV